MVDDILAEKHRPKTLSEVIGQDNVTDMLKRFVKTGKIPHMLFSGPPGVGKTAAAVALAKDLFGSEWRQNFYSLNASDDRKLETVRKKIKPVAQQQPLNHPFKIIFLDEADSLDSKAQPALRTTIERYSDITRFIFSCNYPNKIIPPIADRLADFRFKLLSADSMKFLLQKIVQEEQISIEKNVIHLIASLSKGSMRKALTVLSEIQMGDLKEVNEETIYKLTNWVDYDYIKRLLSCVEQEDLEKVDRRIDDLLYNKVYDVREILEWLYKIVAETDFSQTTKLKILYNIGVYDYRLAVGATQHLQLKTLMCYIMLEIKKERKK